MGEFPSLLNGSVRNDFPILRETVHGKPLVYFDNAATTQKPSRVLAEMRRMYEEANGNVHRSAHLLGNKATEAYESARITVQKWIGAEFQNEIVFTHGDTEAINLIAFSFGEAFVQPGDEIIVSEAEHHSNFLPWQQLCARKGARLNVVPLDRRNALDMGALQAAINPRTRLIAVTHVSNVLGVVNPAEEIVRTAHERNVPVLLDGAQAVSRIPVNVARIGCDFYCFSGHKMYGPNGTGVLYINRRWAERLPPYQTGGEMADTVSAESSSFLPAPLLFEAGTPNYVGAAGLAEAVRYLEQIGIDAIQRHEDALCAHTFERLRELPGINVLSTRENCAGVISFVIDAMSIYDAALLLDSFGVAVRAGAHCAQPIMRRLGVDGTLRVSFGLYNTAAEIDAFICALKKTVAILKKGGGA